MILLHSLYQKIVSSLNSAAFLIKNNSAKAEIEQNKKNILLTRRTLYKKVKNDMLWQDYIHQTQRINYFLPLKKTSLVTSNYWLFIQNG